jgi:hypothetical protein
MAPDGGLPLRGGLVLAGLISAVAVAGAAEWIVDDDGPADFQTIQEAILAAYVRSGDTLTVRPGIYRENLYLLSKDLVVRSERGAFVTVIDGGAAGSVVMLENRGAATRIEGFTIRNGRDQTGGGVWIFGGGPVVTRNIIEGNSAIGGSLGYAYGGGVEIYSSAATITYNVIRGNTALDGGAGIDVYYAGPGTPGTCCPLLDHNTIVDNVATGAAGIGGGILSFASAPLLRASIVAGNRAASGGGLAVPRVAGFNDSPTLEYDLFHANLPDDAQGASIRESNRVADPRLGPGPGIELWPRSDSPAVDYDPAAAVAADLAGRWDPVDGDYDGAARRDAGALESPGEITGLVAASAAAGGALLTWDGSINAAATFNVYGLDEDPFRIGGGVCLAAGLAVTSWEDPGPPPGRVRYYLVTGRDVVEGSRGTRSDGTPRPAQPACPLP